MGLMMKRTLRILGMAMGFLAGLAAPARSAENAKPNIIFIMADDLGYGDLGCYGQEKIQTPRLDRMAAEGMRFTDYYAGATVCAPSRSSLVTGTHTGHTRVRGNDPRLPLEPGDVTFAEVLKEAGYITGIVGKWGLGEPDTTGIPPRQGFDEWFGFLNQKHAHNYYPDYLWRNEERIELPGNRDGAQGQYVHDLFTEEALKFVERHREGPFFLYLSYTIPHANNEAGPKGMQVPDDAPYSNEPWPQAQKNHAAMITRMDRDVGSLLDRLMEYGIDENTIVFFTSDNGPHKEGGADPNFFKSSGPLRGIKRDLYDGGIRVPMIARWPGKIAPGAETNRIAAHWDVLPTLAELGGGKTPENVDGISLLPVLVGKSQREHAYLYWEFHERGKSQGVRAGDWKAVRVGPKWQIELYNLKDDLSERNNIAAEHPEIVARMEHIMNEARSESAHWPTPGPKRSTE